MTTKLLRLEMKIILTSLLIALITCTAEAQKADVDTCRRCWVSN